MDSTLACLAAWMPRQRWYAAKGRVPSLRFIAAWDLPDPFADSAGTLVRVRTFLVSDETALPAVLYQIPVVARATSTVDAAADHVIGSPEPGTTLIDGPFDASYTEALLRLVTRGGEGIGAGAVARGVPSAATATHIAAEGMTSSVMGGEQSNTSIVYHGASGATPIICKVFRQIHPGLSPDIELQTALADSGSRFVPRAVGSVAGIWPDPEDGRRGVDGSLAFAQEVLPDVEDAWRVALHAAAAGEDFTSRAHDLGVATADVHMSLAGLFHTRTPSAEDREAMETSWRRRLSIAIAEVPALAASRSQIESVYAGAMGVPWPPLQRIHGDYHLGQVILVPNRGWVLVDFEGEPMRPMAERVRPDLPLRDVAGMLRSFDYVAGSIRLDQPDGSPASVRDWARTARLAFLDGYAEASAVDLAAARLLLDALELDKAVYEAIYEARNRPTWIVIPLRAITRLSAR
jgi:predicted trehalose synthase